MEDEPKDCTVKIKALGLHLEVRMPDAIPLSDPSSEMMKVKIMDAVECVKNGMSILKACETANVSRSAFYKWLNKAPENKEYLYSVLDERVFMVEDALYKSAMSGEFKAQVFFLTNRSPDRWKHINQIVANFNANIVNNTQNNTVNVNSDEIRAHTERIRSDLERYL